MFKKAITLINSAYEDTTADLGGVLVKYDPLGFPVFSKSQMLDGADNISIIDDVIVRKKGLSNMRSDEHMEAATRALKKKMENAAKQAGMNLDDYLKGKGLTPKQIGDIKSGGRNIEGYTWHHHPETGRMQLVKKDIHQKAKHNGGNSLWGDGTSIYDDVEDYGEVLIDLQ